MSPGRSSASLRSPRSASSSCTGTTSAACSRAPSRASRGRAAGRGLTGLCAAAATMIRRRAGRGVARSSGRCGALAPRGCRARAASPCSRATRALRHGAARSPTEDRPAAVAGRTIQRRLRRSLGRRRPRAPSAQPQISADVDEIAAWWRRQDFEREPRFDLLPSPAARRRTSSLVRLPRAAAALQRRPTRGSSRSPNAVAARTASQRSRSTSSTTTGRSTTATSAARAEASPTATGVAIVYLATCRRPDRRSSRPTSSCTPSVRSRAGGPPHACPDRPGAPLRLHGRHPVPVRATRAARRARARRRPRRLLRAPAARWLDVQDSRWLRASDAARCGSPLTLTGGGSVASDVPGVDCTATLRDQWDSGTEVVTLNALPAAGQRFVRWAGACTGTAPAARVTLARRRSP